MRRLILVAGALAGLALGWLAVPLVFGGEAEKKPAAPAPPVAPAAPSASTPAPKAPAAPSTATAPAKPTAPDATAKDPDAGPVGEDITITPPPPLPPVAIPPIPQASDQFPFGQPESKEEREKAKAAKEGKSAELTTGPDKPKTTIGEPRKILEEGKRIFNREGRVGQDEHKQTVIAFGSGEGSILLLENSWRDFLETTTDFGKKDAHWRVSGLVTVYGHKNYLLITKCVRVMPEEENR